MSQSTAATMSLGRNWAGMPGKRPISKQTLIGSGIVIAVALAIFLSWLLFWSGSNSFSASEANRSGGGFDGDSVPSIAPSPAGEQSVRLTFTDADFRDEAAVSKASGAPFIQGTRGSAEVSNTIGSRQIISQGSMSVEVTDVSFAAARVRTIAEGVGGFVEQLSSHGVGEFQQSTMTVRVPQDEFFSVFEQIKSLGKVQNENAGTEDVTEQFIDLEARLTSTQREELSLLSLLERADTVNEILVIERELSRVRTDLERFQGQLNFLKRRVDLATITVSLNHPQRDDGRAPYGSLDIETSNVDSSVIAVKAMVSQLNGEVDQVFTSLRDGHQQAVMTVRVFADDFNLVVATVEDEGGIISKEIREGAKGDPVLVNADDEEPNARLDIVFADEEEESSNLGRNLAIFIPVGSVAGLIVLGLLLSGAYRIGLRKED